MPEPLRVCLLARKPHKKRLYNAWIDALPQPPHVLDPSDAGCAPPPDTGVVVATQLTHRDIASLRPILDEGRLPVLTLPDGILEFRNTFERPDAPPGRIFQPALGHKLACFGRSQVRVLESWGNLGRCELVGAPRLDRLLGRRPRRRAQREPFRLLVMTARKPGFTPEQRERIERSLADVKHWLAAHPRVWGLPLEPVWRLTEGLDQRLGVPNTLGDLRGDDLADLLATLDAVLTTPSTALLEAMLQGVPVALLDYTNRPALVPAAWSVTAQEHLDAVLPELLAPPPARMLWQDTLLHDALECRTPATPRLIELIEAMSRIGAECRTRGVPLAFPPRILADPAGGHHLPEPRFDLAALYPDHPVFANLDRAALQVELEHLRFAHAELARENDALRAPRAEPDADAEPAAPARGGWLRRLGRRAGA